jgi:hypothetical protein
VLAVERGQRRADPRAARPVGDGAGGAVERAVGVAPAQLVRHAGQPGAERERLDAPARGDAGLDVLEQHAGVRRHRAGDVADEDERARAVARRAPVALERLAGVAQRRADRAAQVGGVAAAPARRDRPARPAARTAARELLEDPARRRPLGVGVQREVLRALQRDRRPRGGHGLRRAGLLAARRLVGGGRRRDPRQPEPGDLVGRDRRLGDEGRAEHLAEGVVEHRDVLARRAQGRAQWRSRVSARDADVDGPRSAWWRRRPLPTPTPDAAGRGHAGRRRGRRPGGDDGRPGRSHTPQDPVRPDAVDVLSHLQRRAQRRVEVVDGGQRARPR